MARASQRHLGPSGSNVILDKNSGARRSPRDGVDGRDEKRDRARRSVEIWPAPPARSRKVRIQQNFGRRGRRHGPRRTVSRNQLRDEYPTTVTAGANPKSLQRGIMKDRRAIVEELKKISKKKVSDRTRSRRVASRFGQLGQDDRRRSLPNAMDRSARTAQHGRGSEIDRDDSEEVVEGMQFDKVHLSPYFVTNREDGVMEGDPREVRHPHFERKSELKTCSIAEKVAKAGRRCSFIAEDGKAKRSDFVVNKLRAELPPQSGAVKARASAIVARRC